MVYGRYIELANGVYKPTNITGGNSLYGKLALLNDSLFAKVCSMQFNLIHPFISGMNGLLTTGVFFERWNELLDVSDVSLQVRLYI
jgi:hypothetical protein